MLEKVDFKRGNFTETYDVQLKCVKSLSQELFEISKVWLTKEYI